ncbi:MAG: hypothetical protein V3V90_03570 [Thermodesulfobacteriota bacterium]
MEDGKRSGNGHRMGVRGFIWILILRLRLTDFRAPLGVNHSYAQRNRWIRRLEDWLGANSEEAAEVFSNHP